MRRQGEEIVLPLLITVGYLTARSQSVHLSEGIGELFPDVSLHRFLLVVKKKACKSRTHGLTYHEGGIEKIFLTVLVYTLI